jgi:cyclopropane fatty-acyl-phospholipid synthase-like methyltransferase
MKTPERFEWAVEMLDVQPNDRLFEIGCGTGIAVELVAKRLINGSITAIDRSDAMIKSAAKRNAGFIKQKKVRLISKELADAKFDDQSFNKIFAFNVNVFWKGSKKEFDVLRPLLNSDGKLCVFYQPPYEKSKKLAGQIVDHLKANGFKILDTVFKKLDPDSTFCIIAKPQV